MTKQLNERKRIVTGSSSDPICDLFVDPKSCTWLSLPRCPGKNDFNKGIRARDSTQQVAPSRNRCIPSLTPPRGSFGQGRQWCGCE